MVDQGIVITKTNALYEVTLSCSCFGAKEIKRKKNQFKVGIPLGEEKKEVAVKTR